VSSNVLFLTQNNAAGATLSAGSEATPVIRLQHPKLSVKWRSTDLLPASTTIGIDFGPTAGSGPLALHRVLAAGALSGNFSPTAQAVFSLGDTWVDQGSGLLSGWNSGGLAPIFPSLVDDSEILHGLRGYLPPTLRDRLTRNAFFVPPTDVRHAYRYGRIDFDDPDNPDGFVELGGLVAGPGIIPPDGTGIQPGWAFEPEDTSEITSSDSGYESVRARAVRRVLRFTMNWLDFDRAMETFGQVFDLHLGTTRPFLTLPFPDLGALWLLGLWGLFRRPTGVNESAAFHFQKGYELVEIVR